MNRLLKKILYVEDEPDIQEISKIALGDIGGYELAVCSSGEEAIEKGPLFSPDLIILDVMMPGMDGLATFNALQKIEPTKSVPVIFMTAKIQQSEIQVYLDMGAIGIVHKPFDPMTLADKVKEIWEDS